MKKYEEELEETEVEEEEDKRPKGPSKFSLFLNKYFHHVDRGGTLKNEIFSGIMAGVIVVCALYMNMQVIGSVLISDTMSNSETANIYAGVFFMATIIAAIGSFLIGIIARLPLVQCAALSTSSIVISTIGANSGLTYYNLLAVCFVSSILYTVLVSIPAIRNFLYKGIPLAVRKALPAAAGLLITFIALQLAGIINISDSGISINSFAEMSNLTGSVMLGTLLSSGDYASDIYSPYLILGFICAAITIILYFVFRWLHKSHPRHFKSPVSLAFLLGTVLFLLLLVVFCLNQFTNWGRLWMVGGNDAYMNHVLGNSITLDIGKVFTEGFDFSEFIAEGGNIFLLFASSALSFLFISLFDAEASLQSVKNAVEDGNPKGYTEDLDNKMWLATICNAGMNVVASVAGTVPVGIGKESSMAAEDNAKSGIASIVAGLVMVISAFIWIVPFLFATYTASASIATTNMYGHINSGALAAVTNASFGIADAVMAAVGLSVVFRSICKFDFSFDPAGSVAFVATIAGVIFTSNIAYGAAVGIIAYCIFKLCSIKKNEEGGIPISLKEIGIPTAVVAVAMVILLLLAYLV